MKLLTTIALTAALACSQVQAEWVIVRPNGIHAQTVWVWPDGTANYTTRTGEVATMHYSSGDIGRISRQSDGTIRYWDTRDDAPSVLNSSLCEGNVTCEQEMRILGD